MHTTLYAPFTRRHFLRLAGNLLREFGAARGSAT
jgi:hypothetical protein